MKNRKARTLVGFSLIATVLAAGCATIGGNHQYVVVKSEPPGEAVRLAGQSGAPQVTPFIADLRRGRRTDLNFYGPNGARYKTHLQGHYRWGRSLAGNLLFLSFAPAGWIVDLISGAAWYYKPVDTVQLPKLFADHGRETQPRARKTSAERIAIAPPVSNHANISDEAGRWLETRLRHDLPGAQILPYSSTIEVFHDDGLDYDRSNDPDLLAKAYHDLDVSNIYFAEVEDHNSTVHVSGELKNVYDSTRDRPLQFEIPKNQIEAATSVGIVNSYSDLLYWLPNSVGLDLGQTNTSLTANGVTIGGKSSYDSTVLGHIYEIVSAVSVRHIFQPMNRKGWHYRVGFSPTFTFSYAKEHFENDPLLNNVNFTRLHADAGWGPNFNFENRRWSFYFDLQPIVEYDDISSKNSVTAQHFEDTQGNASIALELGAKYFFTPHWLARFYVHSSSLSSKLWEKILGQVENQNVQVKGAELVSTGLGINYVFGGETLKFWK